MKRKIVLFMVCFVYLFSLFSIRAEQNSDKCGDNLKWSIDGTGVLTISGQGAMYDFEALDELTTAPWRSQADSIKKLEIKNGITYIGNNAFYGLSNLESVIMADSVEIMGTAVFRDCKKLKNVHLSESLIEVSYQSFYENDSLVSIVIPRKVQLIHKTAFYKCDKLKRITLPKSLVYIYASAFSHDENLSQVFFEGTKAEWDDIDVSNYNTYLLESKIYYSSYNPFDDVSGEANYLKSIVWAYLNNVIAGTSDKTFSPDENCTRGQLAVMLYRMYGKPSISGMTIPFTDVKTSAYYYKAVVWAYNKGYIKGTSATSFKPEGSITRQDMVVILWRINGSKVVDIENPFTDVDSSSYAYKAIMWAYKNKITSGTSSSKFSPKANCLRYQLAVFLNKFNNIQHIIS
ncbi:MAG: S-layer homology domain-containing protein [Clostridia bacterium]|nr:S-layer homology domain-containing protein [Clostridia bacterium]